jgi:16S rRNA (guanine527-N7)-methyltransferase
VADEFTPDPVTAADPESAAVAGSGAVGVAGSGAVGAAGSGAVADAAIRQVAVQVYGNQGFLVISRYRDILASRGIDWGLIGPREVDRLWGRHILNSAAVASLLPTDAAVADVGSGAGLPGIPIAVLRPDLTVELIEPLLRRSTFLTHTVDELGITDRVVVRRARAEEVRRTYDAVLSRALAPLDRLLRWCLPLMAPTGQILAIKGASASDEVAKHQRLIAGSGLRADVLTVSSDPGVEPTTVVRLQLR